MKKVILFILSIVYFASSVGATVHLHYCMDQFVNWSLADKEGDSCDKCGMKKDGNCCKDEQKFIKNTVDQKTSESAIQLMQIVASGLPVVFVDDAERYTSSLIEISPINAPPLFSDVGLNILNCVFRI